MKTKSLSFLSALTAVLVLTGCNSIKITPGLVQQGVGTLVAYDVSKYPQTVPEVRIAGEVICSAAHGTNIAPAKIVAQIQKVSPNISPETTLIINGALALYIGIWDSYGTNAVNKVPRIAPYLQATCSGINDGLPGGLTMTLKRNAIPRKPVWPIVTSRRSARAQPAVVAPKQP